MSITVAEPLEFQGYLEFPLDNVAIVQAFVFADIASRSTGRILIVQFEEFLSSNDHMYRYDDAVTVEIAGLPFLTDVQSVALNPLPPAESDTGRIVSLLRERGVPLPPQSLTRRFVHFPDEAHRKELLVQYAEARGDQMVDPSELLKRALDSFVIIPHQQDSAPAQDC